MYQIVEGPTNAPSISGKQMFIQTTLYDLIKTVDEIVAADDDQLVTEVVLNLLNSRQTKIKSA